MQRRTSRRFPCANASPSDARRFCTTALDEWLAGRPEAADVISDAEIIVSELLTNAVEARCSGAELRLSMTAGRVRIEVLDDAPGRPIVQRPTTDEQRGRGLLIIAALASDWGVSADEQGKRVWAELGPAG